MPVPTGTGFFVSGDGWFITAAHVVKDANGTVRSDINQAWLEKEPSESGPPSMVQWPTLDHVDDDADVALLKLDFEANQVKEGLKGRSGFPHLTISSRVLEEAEPVYAFGYPLSEGGVVHENPVMMVGATALSPRTTSAIVASTLERTGMVMSLGGPPDRYVLDKALNYGNSGGPIIATETGHAHAVCTHFQPVAVVQSHLKADSGDPITIHIPSLYGVVTSLGRKSVQAALADRGIPVDGT